jgi:hypothetical protein
MIDVPDRSYVYVRLAAVKFFFRHFELRISMRSSEYCVNLAGLSSAG